MGTHRREVVRTLTQGTRGGRLRHIITMAAVTLIMSGPAAAQAVLTDDAHTRSGADADANFGTNPGLLLAPAGAVYLKFDVAAGLPSATPGTAVEKAILRLYLSNVANPGPIEIHAVADSWSERTITGNTAPASATFLGTTDPIQATDRRHFLVVDVTSLVQQWLGTDGAGTNGLPNHGLALMPSGETAVTFDSKENAQTSHEPALQIQLRHSSGGEGVTSVAVE